MPTLSRLERGLRSPSLSTLVLIADALDVPLLFLLPMIAELAHGASAEETLAIMRAQTMVVDRLLARQRERADAADRLRAIRERAKGAQ